MSDVTTKLAAVLRHARMSFGLSQKEACRRAKLGANYLTTLERGRQGMTVATLDALAKVYGVRASDLLRCAEEDARLIPARVPGVPLEAALSDEDLR